MKNTTDVKKKIGITSDCVCDLTDEILEKYGVEVIHFYIKTDHGTFKDVEEITDVNIVEYFENGGRKISTHAPKKHEFEAFFRKSLEKYEEIIHITITSNLSLSYEYAVEIAKKFDGRVHIVDSRNLSTGLGHMVLKASEMAAAGSKVGDIINSLESMKDKISTSFIAYNADYLYRTGRISKAVKDICYNLNIHPILSIDNGLMKLKGVQFGSYEKAVVRYVKNELRRQGCIDKRRVFITQASCSVKLIALVTDTVKQRFEFDEVMVTKASATISGNCGPDTIGVLFVRE